MINIRIAAFLLFALPFSAQAITLKEAIEDAIIHNPQFREDVKFFRAIEAENEVADAGYYPNIDINLGIGYEEVNNQSLDNSGGDGLTRREASVKATQNLFNGFGTQKEIKRQKYRLDAQAFKAESTANDIALSMAEAYIELLTQDELLKLSKDNLETHKKILDQIMKRNDAGIGNEVELDQAKARFALAQSNHASSKNDYYDARAKFRRTLGRNTDNHLTKPKFKFKLPDTLKTATNVALLDHPTLKSASADIAEARLQFESAKKGRYPSIDLELEKTFDYNLAGVRGHNENLQAMLRLRYNLYNGGKDTATIAKTASSYHQATEIRNNTRRQIIENLRYAWNAHTYIAEQLEFVNQHIRMTHDTLSGYRKQFQLGRRSLLDLLNTENEYVSALKTLISSESKALTAKYRILAATGHLLPEMNIQYSFIEAEKNHNDE